MVVRWLARSLLSFLVRVSSLRVRLLLVSCVACSPLACVFVRGCAYYVYVWVLCISWCLCLCVCLSVCIQFFVSVCICACMRFAWSVPPALVFASVWPVSGCCSLALSPFSLSAIPLCVYALARPLRRFLASCVCVCACVRILCVCVWVCAYAGACVCTWASAHAGACVCACA